ncbi:MAG: FAD binding domain-containing protein [Xanthobacteraceae bacterium]|nr:FAD binding domain-containing protein [Xanthobacteraceae bacterium]
MDLNTITEVARPRNRREISDWSTGDAWLAGGTWLFSEPQTSLSRLIDLSGLDWPAATLSPKGLEIAATCTVAALDALALPAEWLAAPLIGQCCRAFLASFKIWNMATVGGNICLALPAGPMISLTAALEGNCTVWTPDGGERRVAVADFVLGPQRNALRPGELLRAISLPAAVLVRRSAFRKISLSPLGRSAALLIGTLAQDDSFTLTITASTPRPVRLAFDTVPARVALKQRIEAAISESQYFGDVHGAPAWRRYMTLHLAEEIRRELAGAP